MGGIDALGAAEAFDAIGRLCPGMTSLNAHRLAGVTQPAVEALLAACPGLRSLDLSGSRGCSAEAQAYLDDVILCEFAYQWDD